MKKISVAVLGASPKDDRYSNHLVRMLVKEGHEPVPIHPTADRIHDAKVYPDLESIPFRPDILSVYMRAERSDLLADGILASEIPVVIFNPGAENPALATRLKQAGRTPVDACSLVLTSTGQLPKLVKD